MKTSGAKENILKKIKQALATPVPVPFPQVSSAENIFYQPQQEAEIEFAENFTSLQGKFSFCLHYSELVQQLQILISSRNWKKIYCRESAIKGKLSEYGFATQYYHDLKNCDAAITGCEALIARTGSMLLSSAGDSGRTVSVYAPVHICIAYTNQLVFDVKDAINLVKGKYKNNLPSQLSVASGPSRTADIEKTLVTGVHGPKEVFCFLIDS